MREINAIITSSSDAVACLLEEEANLLAAAGMVAQASVIHVVGVGKSGIAAQKIAATLRAHGIPSHTLHPVEALHGDIGSIQSGDIVIAVSASGETVELLTLASHIGDFAIAITGGSKSLLAENSSVVVRTASGDFDACTSSVPSASFTSACIAGDIIAALAASKRGGSLLATTHPGGAIGARM